MCGEKEYGIREKNLPNIQLNVSLYVDAIH